MKLTSHIKAPWLTHTKGALFATLGVLAAALLFAQVPTLKTTGLLAVCVWAFCRLYYYLFYVLENYLERGTRYAGLFDAIKFLLSGSRTSAQKP